MKRRDNKIISLFFLCLWIVISVLIHAPLTSFGDTPIENWPPSSLNSIAESDWISAFEMTKNNHSDFRVESLVEFKAITEYYNTRIHEGIEVHRFQLSDGNTIQCILIHTQGALTSLGLKPEAIQFAPQIEPIDTTPVIPQGEQINTAKLFGLDGSPDDDGNLRACPDGSFPRIIPKLENLYRFQRLEDIYQKYPNEVTRSFPLSTNPIHEYAHAGKLVNNTGSSASFNVWAPYVEQSSEFSLSQLWVPGGSGNNLQTVEAGWQVYQNIYGNNQPHLFIYYTTNNYLQRGNLLGCYNLDCAGFIQTNSSVIVGGPISTVSTIGGNQYDIKLMYLRDTGGSHDWWLKFGDVWVGYYPNILFSSQGLAFQSHTIDYGGEIINTVASGLHTTTQMGSGHFPDEGWQHAAFIRNLKYVDLNNYLRDSVELIKQTTDSSFYDLSLSSSSDPNWLQYFYFGGPGRGCSYSISPPSNSFTGTAGTGSVNVTAGAGCAWTALTNAGSWGWIGISSGGSGTGNGTVNYFVIANNTGSTRTGTLTIAGQTFTITQTSGGCSYSISPPSNSFSGGGSSGSVNVTAGAGCAWTALTNSGSWGWIGISSGWSGSGNGTVNYFVIANNTGSTRTGTLTVAGQTFTITQQSN